VDDTPASRGLVDTSVVIELDRIDPDALPSEIAVSAITLAELAAGPHATDDLAERARRQERLQLTEATFDAIPFDATCARAYGRVYAETLASGRKARGSRAIDLLIAATALAAELPLYTANPSDFDGLGSLVAVKSVGSIPRHSAEHDETRD
jgi:predicted nucleic acid-binding protein